MAKDLQICVNLRNLRIFPNSSMSSERVVTQSRESVPAKKSLRQTQAAAVARLLEERYGNAECALLHASPFQLLVATILSAQCTDERVNSVTPKLFRRYPNAEALAGATQEDVETIIQSLGFFRAKATNIRGMARMLVELHGGEIPQNAGRADPAARSRPQDGECRPGDSLRNRERGRCRHACEADHGPAGPDEAD